jgi:hypothetical protein
MELDENKGEKEFELTVNGFSEMGRNFEVGA